MYDPVTRTYTHKGITYHSVTTIIGEQPKPALKAWAAKVTAEYAAKEQKP